MEELPFSSEPNLASKIGSRVAHEILEACAKVQLGQKVKLDVYIPWNKPIIKDWMLELVQEKMDCLKRWELMDDVENKRRARDIFVNEWLISFNVWDPVNDRNEVFEIADIRGYKKKRLAEYYLLEYTPRILEADAEYPEEFPEIMGKPWSLVDWVSKSNLGRRIGNDEYLRTRMDWYKMLNGIKERGTTVGVEGVVLVGDVG